MDYERKLKLEVEAMEGREYKEPAFMKNNRFLDYFKEAWKTKSELSPLLSLFYDTSTDIAVHKVLKIYAIVQK